MSTALEVLPFPSHGRSLDRPIHILPVPWRDPHTVSPAELKEYISFLEKACQEHPESADFRTCLGMAYAMNYEAQKSMNTLEDAVQLDETHFFAQLKYSELLYRLRALPRAEEETIKALNLAGNTWELSLARKQLQEIRRLIREGTQKPEWNKKLRSPSLALMIMMVVFSLAMVFFKAR
jgi:tetratricopeptide (TPR) repeat protein